MADRSLVLVPHEQPHASCGTLEQARQLGPVTEMRAIKHTIVSLQLTLALLLEALITTPAHCGLEWHARQYHGS